MLTAPLALEFGGCRLDLRTEQLLREGEAVHLAPKCFGILRYLAEHPTRLVSKEELLEAVWPQTNVELAALTVAIGRIRQALGDDPRSPRFIETVHRRGYRFIAGVTVDREQPDSFEQDLIRPHGARGFGDLRLPLRWAVGISSAALLAVAVLWAAGLRTAPPVPAPERLLAHRLTTTGNILKAAVSPDGARIAYVNLEGGREGLRLHTIQGGDDVELLPPAERRFFGFSFTSAGDALLCSIQPDEAAAASLYRIPLLGPRGPQDLGVPLDSAAAFSSDGSRIVFMRDSAAQKRSELWIAAPDGTKQTLLASREPPEYFDYPAWSPDDSSIACTLVGRGRERVSLAIVDAASGAVRTLAEDAWLFARNVHWTKDGRSLLVTGRLPDESDYQIWSVPIAGGEIRPLTGTDSSLPRFAVAPRAETIVGVESRSTARVLLTGTLPTGKPRADARWVTLPQGQRPAHGSGYVGWTADGNLIVEATGKLYLILDEDRAEAIARDGSSGHPSSCGPYIVHTTTLAGRFEVRAYDETDGSSRTLVRGSGFASPHCAPAGDFLIYSAVQPGGWSGLFKMPLDEPGGPARQITAGDYASPAVSNDGRRIAAFWSDPSAVRQTRQTVMAILTIDGQPLTQLALPPTADRTKSPRWTPDGLAVAYVDFRDGAANLWAQPVDGGPAYRLTRLQMARIFSFSWSHDGSRLAVAVGEEPSDLVLLSPEPSPDHARR